MGVAAVILAAGKGLRIGCEKMFLDICGKTTLQMCLDVFSHHPAVNEIIVCASAENMEQCRKLCSGYNATVHLGGEQRQDSAFIGLLAVTEDIVLFHDGARPLVTPEIITRCIQSAVLNGSGIASVALKDTVKQLNPDGCVSTPDRSSLRAVQTPQAFQTELIRRAFAAAYEKGYYGTDDASLLEQCGMAPVLVEGSYSNIKITTMEDVTVARAFLQDRCMQYGNPKGLRYGTGYDVHRLVAGRRLVLGGVDIPFEKGLLGHSDADVLVHAVMDALLGAAGLRDIGCYFPDSDERYKDADSIRLLKEVKCLVQEQGFLVEHVDAVIIAQQPRLMDYILQMCCHIASSLDISPQNVSVKATTTEGLGFAGRGEGMAALAIASLQK
ncbi:MAG: 2-C-methyl-D-erythritol 4-phosphate cytidylyltransferase [Christensenellales bacterium]